MGKLMIAFLALAFSCAPAFAAYGVARGGDGWNYCFALAATGEPLGYPVADYLCRGYPTCYAVNADFDGVNRCYATDVHHAAYGAPVANFLCQYYLCQP